MRLVSTLVKIENLTNSGNPPGDNGYRAVERLGYIYIFLNYYQLELDTFPVLEKMK